MTHEETVVAYCLWSGAGLIWLGVWLARKSDPDDRESGTQLGPEAMINPPLPDYQLPLANPQLTCELPTVTSHGLCPNCYAAKMAEVDPHFAAP